MIGDKPITIKISANLLRWIATTPSRRVAVHRELYGLVEKVQGEEDNGE